MNVNPTRHFKMALRPRSWRVRTRRAFLISLPVALPVWVAYLCLLALAELVYEARAWLGPFWSAPPQASSFSRYNYGAPRKLKHRDPKVVPIREREAA